jgi:hypothetical protein
MGRYAKTDVRVWGDEHVRVMTPIPPCGQGLWARLLISRFRSSIPGLLSVGEAALAEDCGWSLEAFRKAFAEVSRKPLAKADWRARLVWLPNAISYNVPESPNVVKSWKIPWDEAPDCPLKLEAYRRLKAFMEGLAKGFQEAFAKTCREPSGKPWPNQEQDQEQEQEISHSACACACEPEAKSRSEVDARIRPRNATDLIRCLRVAVQREQPQVGLWNPDQWGPRDARLFLEGFEDVEAALADIEKRIDI